MTVVPLQMSEQYLKVMAYKVEQLQKRTLRFIINILTSHIQNVLLMQRRTHWFYTD